MILLATDWSGAYVLGGTLVGCILVLAGMWLASRL